MKNRELPVVMPVSSEKAKTFHKNKIMNNPFTLIPLVVGAGGFAVFAGWYGLVFTSMWAFTCYTISSVGLGNLLLDVTIREESYKLKYLENHEKLRKLNISETSNYLKNEFHDFEMKIPGKQVIKISKFFANFETVLSEKFFKDTITYAEYLSIAEQIHIAILTKLKEVLSKHRSVQEIDETYINDLIKGTEDKEKIESLNSRLHMKESQLSEVEKLIGEIEKTLTGLAELTVKVSNISDTSREMTLNNLRKQASELAIKTNLYLPEKGI